MTPCTTNSNTYPANQSCQNYTCNDYRLEMQLIGLTKQLSDQQLTIDQQNQIMQEIKKIKNQMGL